MAEDDANPEVTLAQSVAQLGEDNGIQETNSNLALVVSQIEVERGRSHPDTKLIQQAEALVRRRMNRIANVDDTKQSSRVDTRSEIAKQPHAVLTQGAILRHVASFLPNRDVLSFRNVRRDFNKATQSVLSFFLQEFRLGERCSECKTWTGHAIVGFSTMALKWGPDHTSLNDTYASDYAISHQRLASLMRMNTRQITKTDTVEDDDWFLVYSFALPTLATNLNSSVISTTANTFKVYIIQPEVYTKLKVEEFMSVVKRVLMRTPSPELFTILRYSFATFWNYQIAIREHRFPTIPHIDVWQPLFDLGQNMLEAQSRTSNNDFLLASLAVGLMDVDSVPVGSENALFEDILKRQSIREGRLHNVYYVINHSLVRTCILNQKPIQRLPGSVAPLSGSGAPLPGSGTPLPGSGTPLPGFGTPLPGSSVVPRIIHPLMIFQYRVVCEKWNRSLRTNSSWSGAVWDTNDRWQGRLSLQRLYDNRREVDDIPLLVRILSSPFLEYASRTLAFSAEDMHRWYSRFGPIKGNLHEWVLLNHKCLGLSLFMNPSRQPVLPTDISNEIRYTSVPVAAIARENDMYTSSTLYDMALSMIVDQCCDLPRVADVQQCLAVALDWLQPVQATEPCHQLIHQMLYMMTPVGMRRNLQGSQSSISGLVHQLEALLIGYMNPKDGVLLISRLLTDVRNQDFMLQVYKRKRVTRAQKGEVFKILVNAELISRGGKNQSLVSDGKAYERTRAWVYHLVLNELNQTYVPAYDPVPPRVSGMAWNQTDYMFEVAPDVDVPSKSPTAQFAFGVYNMHLKLNGFAFASPSQPPFGTVAQPPLGLAGPISSFGIRYPFVFPVQHRGSEYMSILDTPLVIADEEEEDEKKTGDWTDTRSGSIDTRSDRSATQTTTSITKLFSLMYWFTAFQSIASSAAIYGGAVNGTLLSLGRTLLLSRSLSLVQWFVCPSLSFRKCNLITTDASTIEEQWNSSDLPFLQAFVYWIQHEPLTKDVYLDPSPARHPLHAVYVRHLKTHASLKNDKARARDLLEYWQELVHTVCDPLGNPMSLPSIDKSNFSPHVLNSKGQVSKIINDLTERFLTTNKIRLESFPIIEKFNRQPLFGQSPLVNCRLALTDLMDSKGGMDKGLNTCCRLLLAGVIPYLDTSRSYAWFFQPRDFPASAFLYRRDPSADLFSLPLEDRSRVFGDRIPFVNTSKDTSNKTSYQRSMS